MTGRSALLAVALVAAVAFAANGCGGEDEDIADIPGLGATRIDVPRPTGAGSASCDEDPLPPPTDETIVERVTALRAIGLFADRTDLSDADLAVEIESNLISEWGDPGSTDDQALPIPLDDPFMDLFVADQDGSRVWWSDLEAPPAGFQRYPLGRGESHHEGGLVECLDELEPTPGPGDQLVDHDQDARVDPVVDVGRLQCSGHSALDELDRDRPAITRPGLGRMP